MVDVTIYTRMMCGYCTAAKRLLERKGVAFTEHDASFSPELRQEMVTRAKGRATFPQIFVGNVHVGGCDDLHDLDAEGRLDGLLATGSLG
ncbi:MAG: glutaredoxin 3 [Proteobacteria bacterium]|jgi:glutaredoxin 3|uniref:glutaredoxin 3 n=1 Tax=Hyphomicrobiales TaxID=356 RepID=UPI00037779C8|nr:MULTISPECIES: glutaredoxin 3 [Phyllobacteriaceae]MCA0278654.1 glutaredoxin 3 [Pseudomonadota bacterium]MCX8567840.1 glutaredoxin 3 [Aminobacter sp. MET-1]